MIVRIAPTAFFPAPLDFVRTSGAVDCGAMAGATVGALPGSIDPQCLHLIAASWISSAQYGHAFTGRV